MKTNTLGVQVVETICARKSPWTGSALCHIMGFLICNFSPNCYFHDDRCGNFHKIQPPMLCCYNIDANICICQTTIVRNVVWYNLKLWPFHTIYGWACQNASHALSVQNTLFTSKSFLYIKLLFASILLGKSSKKKTDILWSSWP